MEFKSTKGSFVLTDVDPSFSLFLNGDEIHRFSAHTVQEEGPEPPLVQGKFI